MFTVGAKTEERQRVHLKALLEFHVQKPEETINKKGPQGNFPFCLAHRDQEDVYGSVGQDDW